MTKYKIITGNSPKYVESEINYCNKQYEKFKIHGGISNEGGFLSVLVSYVLSDFPDPPDRLLSGSVSPELPLKR